MSRRRRPKRSPSPPAASRSPAKTSREASTIHWSWRFDAPRSVDSVGNAMLTINPSSVVMNTATDTTASANHLLRSGTTGGSVRIVVVDSMSILLLRAHLTVTSQTVGSTPSRGRCGCSGMAKASTG